jgi:hypothetical protein
MERKPTNKLLLTLPTAGLALFILNYFIYSLFFNDMVRSPLSLFA